MSQTLEEELGLSSDKNEQPQLVAFAKHMIMQIYPSMKHDHPHFFRGRVLSICRRLRDTVSCGRTNTARPREAQIGQDTPK